MRSPFEGRNLGCRNVVTGLDEPEGWHTAAEDLAARQHVGRALPRPHQLLQPGPVKLVRAQVSGHLATQTCGVAHPPKAAEILMQRVRSKKRR